MNFLNFLNLKHITRNSTCKVSFTRYKKKKQYKTSQNSEVRTQKKTNKTKPFSAILIYCIIVQHRFFFFFFFHLPFFFFFFCPQMNTHTLVESVIRDVKENLERKYTGQFSLNTISKFILVGFFFFFFWFKKKLFLIS